MRRSICYCEPQQCLAGEISTWRLFYTPASELPKGTKLRIDLLSQGREIDWEIPSVDLKKGKNVLYLQLEEGTIITGKATETKESPTPVFDFLLPKAVKAGSQLLFVLGAPKSSTSKTTAKEEGLKGNRAQCNTQRRRAFHLLLDPSGKGKFSEPEIFSLDIRGNVLKNVRILTPSFVVKNRRFDVILRFEDEFGNLTNQAPDDSLFELSYEHLRDNLRWKLFVPETGFINLPNLYFSEPGIYTLRLKNLQTKAIFSSPPLRCFPDGDQHLFWGLLHGESERFDSTESIDSCLRHFRDEKALNFYGVSPFESQEETPAEIWRVIAQNVNEFNEEDRFVTFHGVQWNGTPLKEGIRHILYTKEMKQPLRKKEVKASTLERLYASASPKEFLSIPCFTMAKGYEYDFKAWNKDFERVVEIYNAWGSSECLKKEGNLAPICSSEKKGVQESAEGAIQKALRNNCRFGFVAGGLDDRGLYAPFYEGGQEQYPPGLTAIIAPSHNRAALTEALHQRACYATTGERILAGLYLAGYGMGQEISTADKPGLLVHRHLSGYVAGTSNVATIEIIRNGKVLCSFEPKNSYSFEFEYDDVDNLADIVFPTKDKAPPFLYYYLRVTQEDGHMAWTSPIWLDYVPVKLTRTVKKPAKAVKPPAALLMEIGDEGEDD